MDSGTEKPAGGSSGGSAPRPEPPRTRIEGAPRGRSAGAPGPEVFKCSRCGQKQILTGELESDLACKCGADLHTCTNCKFFDTSTQWECKATIPARVAPKDKANQCGLFDPKIIRDLTADKGPGTNGNGGNGGHGGNIRSADDARRAFENLFKK